MVLSTDARIALLPVLEALARQAGALILDIYRGDFQARSKADASPVTEADERAEALITAGLRRLTPTIPVVAEEEAARGECPVVGHEFWLVDPLDGTREFVSRNGEFTVNIALIQQGEPVLGVVLAPALGRLFSGVSGQRTSGGGTPVDGGSAPGLPTPSAWVDDAAGRRPIAARRPPAEGLAVVGSRSHGDAAALDAFLKGRRVASLSAAGSSLKFCLLAAGEADLYPRLGRTMEWDTAAGHAVLAAAGGRVDTLAGGALRYGKPGFENPHFVAHGRD
jgi:3'(2'), 5'-bisphosphate nucleotidase